MNKLNIDKVLRELETALRNVKKYLSEGKDIVVKKINYKNDIKLSSESKEENEKFSSPDIKRFKSILKRNNLKVPQTAELLGVSTTTVYNWFYETTNPKGKINKKYFDLLSENGYK